MLIAKVVCSDRDCHEEREIEIAALDDLDGLVCECGHGFVLAYVYEQREPGGELIPFARPGARPQARPRRAA